MSRRQSLIGVALLLWCREGATASAASTEQTSVTERSQRVRATFARGSFELTMECDRPAPLVLARATDGVWSLKRGQEVLKGSPASGLTGAARASDGDNADMKACVTGARQDALDAHLAMSARVLIAFGSSVFGERVVIGTLPEVPPEYGRRSTIVSCDACGCDACIATADKAYSDCSAQPVLADSESQSVCGGVYGDLLDSCLQYCPIAEADRR
jgi:hypothetical protein